jgi:putative holliday junction resolvase
VPESPSQETGDGRRGRVLGLDLGSVRIGVAISDSGRVLATPREVLRRSGDGTADLARIASLVEETGATEVVVGLPVSLDGTRGPAAESVEKEVARLRGLVSVPVVLVDERLSSVEATRRRREARAETRRRPASPLGSRHTPVDADAAAIVLQSYLDSAQGGHDR